MPPFETERVAKRRPRVRRLGHAVADPRRRRRHRRRVVDRPRHRRRARRSRRRCARPTAARTTSWPCSPTSCAIRWPRSATAWRCCKLGSVDDRRSARPPTVIDRQARHMARLLDDLLDVSRITRDRLELRRERWSGCTTCSTRRSRPPGRCSTRAGQSVADDPAAGAGEARRRSGPPGAGVRQHPQQRLQVLRTRRTGHHRRDRRRRRGDGRGRPTRASASIRRCCSGCSRCSPRRRRR